MRRLYIHQNAGSNNKNLYVEFQRHVAVLYIIQFSSLLLVCWTTTTRPITETAQEHKNIYKWQTEKEEEEEEEAEEEDDEEEEEEEEEAGRKIIKNHI